MFRIVPQITVADLNGSVSFYTEMFGFTVTMQDPPEQPVFAALEREDSSLFLIARVAGDGSDESAPEGPVGVGVRLYFEVDDARVTHDSLVEGGIQIVKPLIYNEREDYTEFSVRDPDGYEIGIYS